MAVRRFRSSSPYVIELENGQYVMKLIDEEKQSYQTIPLTKLDQFMLQMENLINNELGVKIRWYTEEELKKAKSYEKDFYIDMESWLSLGFQLLEENKLSLSQYADLLMYMQTLDPDVYVLSFWVQKFNELNNSARAQNIDTKERVDE